MKSNERKVLIVISTFGFGGIPTQAMLWAKFIKQNGYSPVILALTETDKRYCELLESNEIEFSLLNLPVSTSGVLNLIKYYRALITELKKNHPLVIFPFTKGLGFQINLIWRFTKAKKCFLMERGNGVDFIDKSKLTRLRKLAIRNSSGLIFNSRHAAEVCKIRINKYVVLNAVNILPKEEDKNNWRQKLNIDGKYILLHIANFYPEKNYEILFNVMQELKESQPEVVLVIIGYIPKQFESEALVKQKLKEPNIVYLGGQDNVAGIINESDVCILSTFSEGCPNVLLEYVCAQKNVIASDIGAVREVLAEDAYAYLFDNSNYKSFIEKLTTIKNGDDKELLAVREANYNKVQNNYMHKNYEEIIKLIQK